MTAAARHRTIVSGYLRRCALACLALVVAYFVVPVHTRTSAVMLAVQIGLSLAALVILVVAIRRQLLRQLDGPDAPLAGLLVGILAGVLLFALADYTVAYYAPSEFAGLRTRLDALYFALTTVLTVGYGDVSARGQVARGLLCAQMLFNVVVLASAASVFARQLTARARARH